jgi:Na+/H+ antiporter NhaD/arsenite permease-like protein
LLYLGIPTIISLVVLVLFIRFFYPLETGKNISITEDKQPADLELTRVLKISLALIIFCIILQVLLTLHPFGAVYTVPLPSIAIAGAAPVILFSRKRLEIIRKIDWPTLVFFVSMFVLMAAVFTTGFFQAAVPVAATSSVFLLYSTSLLISQFISNVPFVALFTPMFQQAGMSVNETMALAAGSTLAGNLTILGAASNVIVIQNAERQGETITFIEFLRLGIPFTLVTSVVFVVWLTFV